MPGKLDRGKTEQMSVMGKGAKALSHCQGQAHVPGWMWAQSKWLLFQHVSEGCAAVLTGIYSPLDPVTPHKSIPISALISLYLFPGRSDMRCSVHIMRLVRNRAGVMGNIKMTLLAEQRAPVVKPPAQENNLKSVTDSLCSFRHIRNSPFTGFPIWNKRKLFYYNN